MQEGRDGITGNPIARHDLLTSPWRPAIGLPPGAAQASPVEWHLGRGPVISVHLERIGVVPAVGQWANPFIGR
jgi:hypothetical protein